MLASCSEGSTVDLGVLDQCVARAARHLAENICETAAFTRP